MSDTQAAESMTFDPEDELHPAADRRARLAKISHDFAHVPVRVGTQQAHALDVIRETSQLLAKQIVEFVPPGSERETAIARVLEAKFWATQAISHRGGQ